MIEKNAGRLFGLIGYINVSAQAFRTVDRDGNTIQLISRDVQEMHQQVSDLRDISVALDLPMSSAVAQEFLGELGRLPQPDESGNVTPSRSSFSRIVACLERLQSLKYEASSATILGLDSRAQTLWSPKAPIFGEAVHIAFPSSSHDISGAAKCLAVERSTACVMHLMRATEVPLKVLAAKIGIGQQNDWGAYIREIGKELESRMKTAGKRTDDEAFFAEAAEAFERIKRAWRNRTMHLEAVYSVGRAEEIFDATRHFMAHLARVIKE